MALQKNASVCAAHWDNSRVSLLHLLRADKGSLGLDRQTNNLGILSNRLRGAVINTLKTDILKVPGSSQNINNTWVLLEVPSRALLFQPELLGCGAGAYVRLFQK